MVQLEGLEANQQLNGQAGLIEAWDFQRARWLVRLDVGEVKATLWELIGWLAGWLAG